MTRSSPLTSSDTVRHLPTPVSPRRVVCAHLPTAPPFPCLSHLAIWCVCLGLIPEFVGRFPVVVNTNGLTLEQMVRVLTEPKNALIKQYRYLFSLHDVDLHITHDALREVATIALRKNTVRQPLLPTCHTQTRPPTDLKVLDVSCVSRVPAVCVRSWRRC